MIRNLLILIAGLLIGAIATAYFLGASRGHALPGVPVRPPDPNVQTTGTVAVTVDEKFFDSLLGTIFRQLGPPQLKLSQMQNEGQQQTPLVTAFVRQTIAEKLNPFEVLKVSQLALSLNVRASGGTLNARVKDVHAEAQEAALKLYLTYDFSAEKM